MGSSQDSQFKAWGAHRSAEGRKLKLQFQMEARNKDGERQNLLTRLLDAVKQCQIRFGGGTELAAENDARVSILCSNWESVLQHGLKHSHKALSTIKQMTEITGLTKIGSGIGFVDEFKNMETEPTFWIFIKSHLSRHELQRYSLLKMIWTDSGRGRAWLRSTLNEHSLEKYMHMVIESDHAKQYYEDWAFMRDQEKASMLPNMAAGLGSILFAISIDNEDLNRVEKASGLDSLLSSNEPLAFSPPQQDEPKPVIANPAYREKKKSKEKKKKKAVKIVSFDEEDSGSSAVVSPMSLTSGVDIPAARPHSSEPEIASSVTLSAVHSTLHHSDSIASSDSVMIEENMVPIDSEGSEVPLEPSPPFQPSTSQDTKSESSIEFTVEENPTPVENPLPSFQLLRTDGDGSYAPPEPMNERMSESDLKQALVAVMNQKDEIEESNRMLRSALEQEQRMTESLRHEVQELRQNASQRSQKDADRIKQVSGENDLLKHQLKKYVSAVQMLRRQGAQPQDFPGIHVDDPISPAIPPTPQKVDYSYEANEYERKLIQVAEMHGELIEFNEVLQRQLVSREQQLRQVRNELISLRGPLPENSHEDAWSIISANDSEESQRPLINIWIPSAFLRGVGSDAFHVYQVYVRVGDEEWNVYRRYSEFLDLHSQLKRKHAEVSAVEFPKKKTIGSKDPRLVEARRRKFQEYLRSIVNLIVQHNSELASEATRAKLQQTVPFFKDPPKDDKKKSKSSRHNASTSQQYNGL